MLTIERLIALQAVIKWNTVFCEAGLNANTMRSAMRNQRELRRHEAAAMMQVLRNYGIRLDAPPEPSLFSENQAGIAQ